MGRYWAGIVDLFAQGYDTTEIATALDIAERTVGTHLQSIYDKVQVRTQAKLVAKFLRSKFGMPPADSARE